MGRGVCLKFSTKVFYLAVPKRNTSYRNPSLLCFRKILVAKKFMEKKGRLGLSKLCVENFLSQVLQRFVEEPFCAVFQNFLVAKKFMEEKWGGGVSKYSVENFLSHSTETFFRGTLLCCVSEKFCWAKKCMDKKEGSITVFRRKLFYHSAKNKIFVVESFSLSFLSGME